MLTLILGLLAFLFYALLAAVVLWRHAERVVNRWFSVYLGAMAFWSLGITSLILPNRPINLIFWDYFAIAWASFVPVAFWEFVQVFLRKQYPRLRWLFYGGYFVIQILNLNNQLVTGIAIVHSFPAFQFGWGIYPMFLFAGSAIILSTYLLFQEYKHSRDP